MPTAEELYESAMAHYNNGDKASAVVQLGEACLLNPKYAAAFNNRGNMLLQLGNVFDAVLNYDRAISIEDLPEYHNNRGAAYAEMGHFDEAERSYKVAIEKKPTFEHALTNLGNVLHILDRSHEASEKYKLAIAANSQYVDAHLNLSFAQLALGQFPEGWSEFEWRWRSNQLVPRGLKYPGWTGQKLNPEEGILIYAEQGQGDALQFCRYGEIIKKSVGCKVFIEVRQPLVRLLKSSLPIDGIISFGEAIPECVTHVIPMMSCPLICGTTIETVPAMRGYLKADPHRAQMFDVELQKLPPAPRIGICWAGERRWSQNAAAAIDKRRSAHLSQFAQLAVIPNIGWVNLQKGPPASQINTPPPGMTILDCMPDCDDWFDTAALISQLDLVISVDTSVLHCAAGLGVETWVLSRYDACWRWLKNRQDNPWYPGLRFYRMEKPNDWEGLMQTVSKDLQAWIANRKVSAAA